MADSARTLSILALIVIFHNNAFAENKPNRELIDVFLREYPAAAAKLEGFYSEVQMRVQVKEIREEGLPPYLVREQQYIRQGDLFRFINDIQQTDRSGESRGDRSVTVANPKFSFRLARRPDQKEYDVQEVASHASIVESLPLAYKPLFAPMSYFEYRIVDFIKEPEFFITNAIQENNRERKFVKIEWEYHPPEIHQRGYFLFDPSQFWALQEYRNLRWQGNTSEPTDSFSLVRGLVHYQGSFDGFPLIHSFRQWVEFHGAKSDKVVNDKPVQIKDYEVLEIKPGPVPEEEFQLSAFGLPNAGEIIPARRSRLLIILNIVLLAFLGTAFLFRQFARRRQQ